MFVQLDFAGERGVEVGAGYDLARQARLIFPIEVEETYGKDDPLAGGEPFRSFAAAFTESCERFPESEQMRDACAYEWQPPRPG